jgi:predicted nucleotidyltransferase
MPPADVKNEIMAAFRGNKEVLLAILFGSYARGTQTEESDVDLIVVLKKRGISGSYSEMLNNRMRISNMLCALREKVPVDVLVYTRDEWDSVTKSKNDFIREVQQTGVVLS